MDEAAARLIVEHASREHASAITSYRALDAKAASFSTLAGIVGSVSIALLIFLLGSANPPDCQGTVVLLLFLGILSYMVMALLSMVGAMVRRLRSGACPEDLLALPSNWVRRDYQAYGWVVADRYASAMADLAPILARKVMLLRLAWCAALVGGLLILAGVLVLALSE